MSTKKIRPDRKPGRPGPKSLAPYLVLAILAVLLLSRFVSGGSSSTKLTFTQFEEKVRSGDVINANISDRSNSVSGQLRDRSQYHSSYVGQYGDDIVKELKRAGVPTDVSVGKGSVWLALLFQFFPILLMIGVLVWIVNSMQGGGSKLMSFGKSKARLVGKDQPKVTFADVAGADEAVEELREIKDFLENPARFAAIGAKIPKGVLLYGPPGTGKTLLARAVAGEAGVPFFTISGSDFVEMFVGVGASRVRDLFEQAKASAPAIVFVDEIDAVGRQRGSGLGGGHDEREQTLNQLLVEMDGFDPRTGVILIAATNRPDILDPALLRPGRFDRQIVVDRPDLSGRRAILAVHAGGKPMGPDVDLDVMARRTPGFSGADIANLLNEAALITARRGKATIGMSEVEAATDRVIAGPERKSRVMSEAERRVIAYHEGGHALVGHVLPNADPIHKISITSRGRALGWTLALPETDKYLVTRSALRDELAMLLGGRSAEELIFSEPTTGAQNDIERATGIARSMVMEFGMSDLLGPQALGQKSNDMFLGREIGTSANYSDDLAQKIDSEIRSLIDTAHSTAVEICTTHRDVLDRLATRLLEKETLDSEEVQALFSGLPTWVRTPEAKLAPSAVGNPIPVLIPSPEKVAVAAARRLPIGAGTVGRARWRFRGLRPT